MLQYFYYSPVNYCQMASPISFLFQISQKHLDDSSNLLLVSYSSEVYFVQPYLSFLLGSLSKLPAEYDLAVLQVERCSRAI
jgi:hypothetical protein